MSGGEVFQNIALLLLQRGHHRHHTLDKARTVLALRAKAALTPLHPRTDRPLRRVIGWFDTLDLHERPQRLTPLQHLTACPCGFGHTTLTPHFQEAFHLPAKRAHIRPKRRALQSALAHPLPPRKHLMRLRQQGVTDLLGAPPRSRMASKSRNTCAQHTCRHRTGYQLYALYRSVTRMPANCSPNSSRATCPPRDI